MGSAWQVEHLGSEEYIEGIRERQTENLVSVVGIADANWEISLWGRKRRS
jgi:hypothetical protein